MRYGFILPGGKAREQVAQAVLAEEAGWDGVFVWEAAYGIDAWTLLGAMAEVTSTVRLGTMLTPLPWRRPWKVASQAATLDQLSGGRAILAVGLGWAPSGAGGRSEPRDRPTRARLLDEGLDVLDALWRRDVRVGDVDLSEEADLLDVGAPVQPRVPVWVVGAWPHPKSMRRVLRCDGLLPIVLEEGRQRATTPEDVRAMLSWLEERGGAGEGFDVVAEGETPGDDPAAWADAGCTWWLDARWKLPHHSDERMREVRNRLAAGPPSVTSR